MSSSVIKPADVFAC